MKKLETLSDDELMRTRAKVDAELRRRGLAYSVGEFGEHAAIRHFNSTKGLPNLQKAPTGTKNIDALSREGERYSIKTICKGRKTGTVYPDRKDSNKQLFEYLLVVMLDPDWNLVAIHEFTWDAFVEVRSWDKRMNAWYLGVSGRVFGAAKLVWKSEHPDNL